ncbi:MAG: metallopeptidase, M24 family protein [Acidobacteria bacterium]|nr:metallopeptidase, M24 family protein [Acidobacteriota bacterium]
MVDRRSFLRASAVTAGAALVGRPAVSAHDLPGSIQSLRPLTDGIVPISDDERRGRLEKARRLMAEHEIDAIYMEGGSGLFYYTGVRWGNSERMFAMVLPARGAPAYVCPKFEEERARELIRFGDDIRTWEEDESPYRRVAEIFRDRGIATGRVGFEERVRFFLYDGIRQEATHLEYVSADPITIGCRVAKSEAELALMQRANDITIAAYKATIATLHEGMTKEEFRANSAAAYDALGASGAIGVNFGESTAYPHGSIQPRHLREGDIVLMDGGCKVEGYSSDMSRTIVFGTPTDRQREIWNLERRAQDAALAAAEIGVPCADVDAAARKVITDAGFGPDYLVPGLPHRTGHGIGLDGHEWVNLVRGNTTPLARGMCFSDEPMVAIYGEFGIRLEDCFHMTDDGPRLFTPQSPSIEEPFG